LGDLWDHVTDELNERRDIQELIESVDHFTRQEIFKLVVSKSGLAACIHWRGTILYANHTLAWMTGGETPKTLVGRCLTSLFPMADSTSRKRYFETLDTDEFVEHIVISYVGGVATLFAGVAFPIVWNGRRAILGIGEPVRVEPSPPFLGKHTRRWWVVSSGDDANETILWQRNDESPNPV